MTAVRRPSVSLLTLGCARNDADSEELAARLVSDGWNVTSTADADAPGADVIVVNTCGFIAAAKAESIQMLVEAAESGVPVVAVGCLAERYGRDLAAELPEAAAVVGFDESADLGDTLRRVMAGERIPAHEPRDRRLLSPAPPVLRGGWSGGPRKRLEGGPVAPLRISSGCDRRCTFCAIPPIRGAFVSRHVDEVLAEATWLSANGVRELVLVGENCTSYGKDMGDSRQLDKLLGSLAAVPGIDRVRLTYLQPAELHPSLIDAVVGTDGVANYFDLSFQHASADVLRRMRRFGDGQTFLDLIARIRSAAPESGIRSNVIVGFPGETEQDVRSLVEFLGSADLDAVGVFEYSDEEDTQAASMPNKLDGDEIAARAAEVRSIVELTSDARASDRIGTRVAVLVELVEGRDSIGRAEHQGVDDGNASVGREYPAGSIVQATVTGSDGVDLLCGPVSGDKQ